MCPFCLTSLAVTVVTTTGAGAAAVALAVRVTRQLRKGDPSETPASKGTP